MAVFAASSYEQSGIVTDVFVLQDDLFYNASVSPDGSGLSAQTVRNYYIYADDIDSDGIIELPMPIQLPSREGEGFWAISWYNLTLEREQVPKRLSYHNYSAGWYLELPESWLEQLECAEVLRELAQDLFRGCPMMKGSRVFDVEWDAKYDSEAL